MNRAGTTVRRLCLFCLCIVAASCGDANGIPDNVTVRDIAGVSIIESAAPQWTPSEALTLSPQPDLVIGDREEREYRLVGVAGVTRLADGRIVIAEGMSRELRIHSANGELLKSAGGQGEGPGELRELVSLMVLPGDTLVAVEGTTGASYFTDQGEFIRRADRPSMPPERGTLALVVAVLRDGAMVVGAPVSGRTDGRESSWIDSVYLGISATDGSHRPVGTFPLVGTVTVDGSSYNPWFGPVASIATTDSSVFLGFGDAYSIEEFAADGRPVRIVRRAWNVTGITAADFDRAIEKWAANWTTPAGPEAEQRKREIRDDPYMRSLPAFSQIVADRVGRLWVRTPLATDRFPLIRFPPPPIEPSVWSVFGPERRWLGDVTMPARFLPMEIGADYVLGVARDELDVPTVVRYRLSGWGGM